MDDSTNRDVWLEVESFKNGRTTVNPNSLMLNVTYRVSLDNGDQFFSDEEEMINTVFFKKKDKSYGFFKEHFKIVHVLLDNFGLKYQLSNTRPVYSIKFKDPAEEAKFLFYLGKIVFSK